jgi:glycine/D-amino acid oxidase-like deaminating enzyme
MISGRKRNLWISTCRENSNYQSLRKDEICDLTIIGGGFTGCSAAIEAAKLGAKVTLLEANDIGFGGSGRNVGLVNAGLWLTPEKIIEILGPKNGQAIIRSLGDAPDLVFSLIEKHKIDCDPQRNGTLHCAHSYSGFRYLKERLNQAGKYGEPLQLLDKKETDQRTGSSKFHGALFDPRAGTIQPLAYCKGLARLANSLGANIYTNSKIKKIEKIEDTWSVHTETNTVKSKFLLLAMNAYQELKSNKIKSNCSTVYYSQFATEPLTSNKLNSILPQKEGCWDTATIMSSFRVDKEGRLIVGTMGNVDGIGQSMHHGWAKKKLQFLFPFLPELEFEHFWQGKIAMTKDHIPKILNFQKNALSCFGYSGRGIAPGTLFGTKAAEALLSENYSCLPVKPIKKYREFFTREKTIFYEMGAMVNNSIQSMSF